VERATQGDIGGKSMNLNPRQRKFVAAMAASPTTAYAAAAAGVSERTGQRYMQNPAVLAALSAVFDIELRRAAWRAIDEMVGSIEVLAAIRDDEDMPPRTRVAAASKILDAGTRLGEMVDLAERVTRLEQRIGGDD